MSINIDKIKEAKKILGVTGAEMIASEIPLERWDSRTLKALSPFKDEKTPSFIWNPKDCSFHCFSTGKNYDVLDHIIQNHKKPFLLAVKELFDLAGMEYDESDFSLSSPSNDNVFKNYKFPKDESPNNRERVEKYLGLRKIGKKTLDTFHVKEDSKGNIAFQFYDMNGIHVMTKYRVSHACSNGHGMKWWFQGGASTCPILYGIDRIDITKTVVICEGLVDALSCFESGYSNVVSINGGANDFGWIDFNYEAIEKIPEIILWFDDDSAGEKATKEIIDRIGMYKTKIVKATKEAKQKIREYYEAFGKNVDKLDANNVLMACGEKDVLKLISNAKEIENPKLKRLFEYDEIELSDLPYVSTGFKAMDKVLYGNFENNLIVLSGYSGAGKSTMISEMGIIAPLEAGKKVMIFSGEANGGTLLGNTFRPLAGKNHIIEYDNSAKGVPNGYAVTYEAKDAIRKYYMSKIWNYEDGEEITTSASEVINTMEYGYKRYGITFFTLDNLMCITCNEEIGEDKYAAQIKFALALKRFTRRYPVTVILVAHPKKPAPGQKMVDLYGISGSSEIINLADRGFAVGILREDPDGYNNYISVIKDRQSAKVGSLVKMRYDRATGRVYSDENELNKKYSWETGFKPKYDDYIKNKLVCNTKPQDNENKEVFGVI